MGEDGERGKESDAIFGESQIYSGCGGRSNEVLQMIVVSYGHAKTAYWP